MINDLNLSKNGLKNYKCNTIALYVITYELYVYHIYLYVKKYACKLGSKSCPFSYSEVSLKNSKDFLDIQYLTI